MALMDPVERVRKGAQTQELVMGLPAPEPTTLLESTWRDFLFSEVWNRPALDHRSRYWIGMCGAAHAGCEPEVLQGYVRGALKRELITLEELREAVLHFAVYKGWVKAKFFDSAVTHVANELGLPPVEVKIVRPEPWDPAERLDTGGANFEAIMLTPAPPPFSAYFVGGIRGFVFAEMWRRPGLDQRARRWITLCGVCDSHSTLPIEAHIYTALWSNDVTPDELEEFALQYAVQSGWPETSFVQTTILIQNRNFREGRRVPPAGSLRTSEAQEAK